MHRLEVYSKGDKDGSKGDSNHFSSPSSTMTNMVGAIKFRGKPISPIFPI